MGCSASPQSIKEEGTLKTPKTELSEHKSPLTDYETLQIQKVKKAYYQAIDSEDLLERIPPLLIEVRSALSDSDKIKELKFKSSIEALNYDRELLDILTDLNLIQKMLIDLKSDTEFGSSQTIQNSYPIPRLPFKLSTMQKIALENRLEILEYKPKEGASEVKRKKELYLDVLTEVDHSLLEYKQSVNAYKLSKEYLDLSEEIYEQTVLAYASNAKNKLIIMKEKFNYFLARLKHSFAYADMQKSYVNTYSALGIGEDSDLSYEKDRPMKEEKDFKLQLQIQKNKRIERSKRLADMQALEEINEIRKQKQFQIMKQQEEKRRLQRIEKRNKKRRLEISKKLEQQRKIDSQKKQTDQMRKIDEIDSLDGVRRMLEEIKAEITRLEAK